MSLGWTVLIIWLLGSFLLMAFLVAACDPRPNDELQAAAFAIAFWPLFLFAILCVSPLWLGYFAGRWTRGTIRRRAARKSQA